jgi:hypothetical protein
VFDGSLHQKWFTECEDDGDLQKVEIDECDIEDLPSDDEL